MPSLSESVAALFIASLKSVKVVDDVVVTEIWVWPLEVKDCPPAFVGSAPHVPKSIVSVPAPTVALVSL